MPRVLIIEDDENTVRRFSELLAQIPDLKIDSAMTSAQARQLLSTHRYQLALVDIELGQGMDGKYAGLSLLRDLNEHGCTSIVVSGTAEDNLQDVSIELDAYDFIGKPVNEIGFINKVNHALTFHASDANPNRGNNGAWPTGLAEDPLTKTTLTWLGKAVNLTLTELSIVRCLVSQPGHVVENRKLATAMKSTVSSAALASHFSNIRRKFRDIDDSFDHITSEPGKGYFWKR